ncbi:MAG: BF3164 family lipoprotein [Bacteroidota bacterium]|nr:BF3164 family lipoprotein [Bacteroidota bacterium]MDE2645108.1 BF3164 family lipoprotein [Bacteroidota bacterium]
MTERHLCSSTTVLLLVPVLLLGCLDLQSRSVSDPFLVQFSTDTLLTYDLKGKLHVHSDSLGNPTDLAIGEKYIFVGEPYADHPVAVFDRDSGEFIAYVGDQGKGPREISFLWSMDFKPGNDSGWIYSYPRVMKFLDDLSITDKTIRLTGAGSPMSPVWIAGERIASTGGYESGRVGFYASTGEFVRTMGPDPPGEPPTPMVVRQHVYEAILKTNSDGTRIVVASQNTDRIELFDASEMLHLVRGPGFHEPVFSFNIDSNGDPRMMVENETIQGYVSVAVTDHIIFALYSGRSRGWVRSQGYFSPPAKTVIAFTWNGYPIGVLGIEDGAMDIGVSSDGQFLYAIYRRPVPMVLRYEVPSLRK